MTPFLLAALLVAIGFALLVAAGVALARRARESRVGTLVEVETDRSRTLRSERYRLVGRPDEIRAGPDGVLIPVELKRRNAPAQGAFYSHTVQVWAYCLLLEEETGRAPPFGVLRYANAEQLVPWNGAARAALLKLRKETLAPYDGRANPTPGKCARCVWSPTCDASAARAGPVRAVASSTPR